MTKIEWTEKTWNPVAGCTWASAGCDHCYAAVMTRRLEAMGQEAYAGLTTVKHFNGKIRPLPDKLDIPLRRKKPTMWFVNSMSDLFHKDVPFEFIDQVFAVMALCPQHTFQVLTKRPERMAEFCNRVNIRDLVYDGMERAAEAAGIADFLYDDQWPLPNVWLGTSVENQEQADKRIPHLLQTPAAVRFLSCEPLLGAVDLAKYLPIGRCKSRGPAPEHFRCGLPVGHEDAHPHTALIPTGSPWFRLHELHWLICGGESGHGARPMHPDWARSLRDQCVAAGVPFFFKQWGEWLPFEESAAPLWESQGDGSIHVCGAIDGHALPDLTEHEPVKGWYWPAEQFADPTIGVALYRHVGKNTAGRQLDGREWNEMPEVARG